MSRLPARNYLPERLLLLAFILAAGTVSFFHEFWRDELQAWMIVSDSHTLAGLFSHTRYEGHPSLWFLILYGLKQFAPGLMAMKVLHLAMAALTAWLVLRYSPFTRMQRGLLIFGYFFLFEYTVIVRNYGLGLLLLTTACTLFPGRRSPRVFLFLSLAIAGMMLSNVYAFFLGAAFLVILGLEELSRKHRFDRRRLSGYALMVAAVVLFVTDTLPPADYGYAQTWRTGFSFRQVEELFARAGYVFFPVPSPEYHFWNTVFYPKIWLQAAVGLAMLVYLVVGFPRKRLSQAFIVLFILVWLVFSYVKFPGYFRHNGHLFLAFLAMAWIEPSLPGKRRPAFRGSRHLFNFILAVQVVAAAMACVMEIVRPFSRAQETAEWIDRNRPGSLVVVHEDTGGSAVAAFLELPPFYPRSGSYARWITWNARRLEPVVTDSTLIRTGDSLAAATGRTVVWLTTSPMELAGRSGLVLLKYLGPSIEPMESYWLYERAVPRVEGSYTDR